MAVLLGGALLIAWLIADPRTPDLAAQAYRVSLFAREGFLVFDEHWYAGHGLPGYGLLFAPVATLIGMRLAGALAVLASIALFEALARRFYRPGGGWLAAGTCLFAVAAVGDVWSGRLTFAFGVTFALACVFALSRGWRPAGAVLAGVCAAASPVAGLLLVLAVFSWALARASEAPGGTGAALGALATVAVPVALVLGPLEFLFPEGGFEPFPTTSFAASVLATAAFLWAVPRRDRLLRVGGAVYLVALLVALLWHTPMGSNLERYGVLLAGPLLLCSVGRERWEGRGEDFQNGVPARARAYARGASIWKVLAATLAIVLWIVWGPVRETRAVAGQGNTAAAYYVPLERFLATHGGGLARVEVPLTRSHWEAALLATRFSLARGWEKQLEEGYEHVLLSGSLSAASYYGWLRQQGVSYVALPDAALDPSSAREGALIRAGQAYLAPVFASGHWRVYAVRGATAILQGPGRLVELGHDGFGLRASRAGRFLVRVRYSRYFTVTAGGGCVGRGPGGWTYVWAGAAGRLDVE
ncbi:MAG TPA: hypothetical protein VL972_02775, partial [Solirubrobacteraceae bacterium]|nr:hypothetical protein [Solirubrobacteraceae bacterium]